MSLILHNGVYTLSLKEEQKHVLKDYLGRYYIKLVADYLRSNTNVVRWEAAREEFIKGLEEANYNLNDIHIKTIGDIHLIFPELIEGDYDLKIRIVKSTDSMHIKDKCTLDNFYKNFKFECIVDLNSASKRSEMVKNILINKVEPVRVDMMNKENFVAIKVSKIPTLKEIILEEIDKLVQQKGVGKEITVKEINRIYENTLKETGRKTRSANLAKQIRNYVSDYRKLKATTLTLGRMSPYPNESYLIERKTP